MRGRDGHSGSPARKIDIDLMDLALHWTSLSRVIDRAPAGLHLETEESSKGFNPATTVHPTFLRLDEFDGTTNACATGAGWSTACLALIWADKYRKYVLAGGSIALFDGHLISFVDKTLHRAADGLPGSLQADVRLARFDTFTPRAIGDTTPVAISEHRDVGDLPSDGESDMVAVNAAGKQRYTTMCEQYPKLLSDPGYRTLTAGTPIVYGALRSRIGMIVDPGGATLHDAAHLFVLNAMGWKTIDLDTRKALHLVAIAEANATVGGSKLALPPTATYRPDQALELIPRVGQQRAATA